MDDETQRPDLRRVAFEDAILTISSNEATILAIRRDGSIADAIGVDSVPSPEQLARLVDQYPDSSLRLVSRYRMSDIELKELIDSSVKMLQWAERNEPKPGANLLRDEDL